MCYENLVSNDFDTVVWFWPGYLNSQLVHSGSRLPLAEDCKLI